MSSQVVGGYQIVEQIGQGGMAIVYRAYDPSVDRFVALKMLGQQYSTDSEFRTRFNIEARAIAMLEHIHILPIHAYGEQDGKLYLVMRYMPHGSLSDRMSSHPQMPLPDVLHYARQIAAALDYAHSRGVLHRDLKPENILLDQSNNCYLADFGLAQLMSTNTRITGNYVVGTPVYMSPEQCMGVRELGPGVDQYALGVLMFEMITGRIPFDHENVLALIQMHVRDVPPSPRSYRPDVPEIAEAAVLQALAKRPEERHASCSALVDAFEQGIASKGLSRLSSGNVPQKLRSRIENALSKVQFEDDDQPPKSRPGG